MMDKLHCSKIWKAPPAVGDNDLSGAKPLISQ